jgi:hypothetical protein
LLMAAPKIGPVGPEPATTAMAPTATMHSEAILTTITLVVTVRRRILLRLSAACYERRQAADLLSPFMTALLVRLLIWLRLVLRTVVHLLVAGRERLGVTRQIGLLLRFSRAVAWFILAHERLGFIVIAVKTLVGVLLAGRTLLLRLLVVIWVLLPELFLRGGDQAKIMLGMLIVVLSGDRITRTLCVARELDIFFRDMRSGTADFDVGTV